MTHMTHILTTILNIGPLAAPTATPTAVATTTPTASGSNTLTTLTNSLGVVIGFIVAFTIIFWLSLIIWTFRDIRSRTQDLLSQILATALVTVFFIGGLFIYMILRPRQTLAEIYERQLEEESLLAEMTERQTCNNCHARVESDFQICPSCGQSSSGRVPSASVSWSYAGLSAPIVQPTWQAHQCRVCRQGWQPCKECKDPVCL